MNKLKLLIDFIAYTGNSTDNNITSDSTSIKNLVTETSFSELSRIQNQIADGASDISINLADSNSEYILIFVDQNVSIKLNGSSDSINLNAKASGIKTFAFYTKGAVTSLTVSNSSGSTANIDVITVSL